MTKFNERSNTLLYKNIPLTLYSWKGWCFLCVRDELETETDCYILTQSSSRDHSSSLPHLGWAAQPWVAEGPSPLSGAGFHSVSILSPTGTELELTDCNSPKPSVAPGYIIVWHPPASCGRTHLQRIQLRPQVKVIFRHPRPDAPASPFFCLFTQAHLLIDGSVEGQYVTEWVSISLLRFSFLKRVKVFCNYHYWYFIVITVLLLLFPYYLIIIIYYY